MAKPATAAAPSGPAKPRVLHVLHSAAPGGGPGMVEVLCEGLARDFEMLVVCGTDGELAARLTASGVRAWALPMASRGQFIRRLPALTRLIRAQRPDIVHLHGHFAGSLGQVAVLLGGRPPTLYKAGWPAYLSDAGPFSRLRNRVVEWLTCRLADEVVAVSDHDRDTLVARRLCAPEKVRVIHPTFRVAADAARAPGPGATVGFVGRLVEQKGCEHLVRAMPDVLRDRPEARLVVVGDGPRRRSLEALAEGLGLDGAVSFRGAVAGAGELMAGFDVLAVPSLYEPFGIVATEAMAAGVPVVASAVGGLREIVADGETGALVPPGDPAAIAAAVNRLLAEPGLRRRWGENGRARAVARFGPDQHCARYAELYRQMLDA